jgi:homoserine kinase
LIWSQWGTRVRVPATSANLGPGFDALGLALGLHDVVEARITAGGLAIEVSGEGEQTAAAGEQHLVIRAMRAAFDALGGQPPGLALGCANEIPHGRGLGSSAAAICSGLLAARALVSDGEARLPGEALFRLAVALEGHPDNVAACLAGGLTIAWTPRPLPPNASTGTGQTGAGQVAGDMDAIRQAATGQAGPDPAGAGPAGTAGARLLRIGVPDTLCAVACVPPEPLSTEAARRVLPPVVPHADAAANAARSALLIAALTGAQTAWEAPGAAAPGLPAVRGAAGAPGLPGAPGLLLEATEDFLHQPYRAAVMPAAATLMGLLRQAGLAAVISGAGPTVLVLSFGATPPAEAVGSIARETGIAWRVIPLNIDRQGADVQQGGLGVHPPENARRGRSWNQVQGPGAGQAGGGPQDRLASSRHTDHCRGNALGSLGVKLVAALGAPPWGQVFACHLPRGRLHSRLWSVILRQLSGSPSPLRVRQRRGWHREPGKSRGSGRATPAAWARFDPSALPADAGLGVRTTAARQGGRTKQLVHNLARPVRRAATPGSPAAPTAGTRALGRTPREQRHHRFLHRLPGTVRGFVRPAGNL